MSNRPIHEWKRRYDDIDRHDELSYSEMSSLIEDANEIFSDLLKGGAECTDQDKRQIVSRKKVKS